MANLPEVRSGGYKDIFYIIGHKAMKSNGVNPVFFLNKDSIL
jgi:hypothetical protein